MKYVRTKWPGIYRREDGKKYKISYDDTPLGGQRQQKTAYADKLEGPEGAKALREKLRKSVRDQTYVPTSTMTLRAFVEREWLPTLTVKPATKDSYRRHVDRHALGVLGGARLQSITPGTLAKLYGDAQAGGLGSSSANYLHVILHQVFAVAVKRQLLLRNPAEQVDPPKRRPPEMKTWDAATLRRFLAATEDDDLGDLYYFLATTGCRRGDALGLAWSDLDLDAGRATIRRTVIDRQDVPEKWSWSTPKTDAGKRTISLDPDTVAMLRAHRKAQAADRLAVGAGWQGSGREGVELVFCGPFGEPLKPKLVSDRFARAVKRLKLPRIRLHDLRHTWATLALQAGVHPKIVQTRLGHSKVSITLDTYSHVMVGQDADAAATVAALFTSRADAS